MDVELFPNRYENDIVTLNKVGNEPNTNANGGSIYYNENQQFAYNPSSMKVYRKEEEDRMKILEREEEERKKITDEFSRDLNQWRERLNIFLLSHKELKPSSSIIPAITNAVTLRNGDYILFYVRDMSMNKNVIDIFDKEFGDDVVVSSRPKTQNQMTSRSSLENVGGETIIQVNNSIIKQQKWYIYEGCRSDYIWISVKLIVILTLIYFFYLHTREWRTILSPVSELLNN